MAGNDKCGGNYFLERVAAVVLRDSYADLCPCLVILRLLSTFGAVTFDEASSLPCGRAWAGQGRTPAGPAHSGAK